MKNYNILYDRLKYTLQVIFSFKHIEYVIVTLYQLQSTICNCIIASTSFNYININNNI